MEIDRVIEEEEEEEEEEEDGPIFHGNRSSDVTIQALAETENQYACGQGNEDLFEDWNRQGWQFKSDKERGISTYRIGILIEGSGQNQNHITVCFSGKESPKSRKKMNSWKMKSATFLTITSQLAGSLLAVAKPTLPIKVQALLYTCVLCNASGFLACLFGLWLKSRRPAAARTLEMVGCAFAIVGFIGMTSIVFL